MTNKLLPLVINHSTYMYRNSMDNMFNYDIYLNTPIRVASGWDVIPILIHLSL